MTGMTWPQLSRWIRWSTRLRFNSYWREREREDKREKDESFHLSIHYSIIILLYILHTSLYSRYCIITIPVHVPLALDRMPQGEVWVGPARMGAGGDGRMPPGGRGGQATSTSKHCVARCVWEGIPHQGGPGREMRFQQRPQRKRRQRG